MANIANTRGAYPFRVVGGGGEWRAIPFRRSPNVSDTTAAPTVISGPVTVARTSTGLYTITLTPGGANNVLLFQSYEAPVGLRGQFWQQVSAVNDTTCNAVLWNMSVGTTTLINLTATTGQVVHGLFLAQCSSYTR